MRYVLFTIALATSVFAHAPFFVANEGQWEGEFAYKCEVGSAVYYVTQSGMTVDLREYERDETALNARHDPFDRDPFGDREPMRSKVRGHVLKLKLVGGKARPEIVGEGKLSSYSNYFIGRDKSRWRSRVGHYQKVVAKEVWPGIDVEYHADARGVETLFRVQPGADLSRIVVEYEGLEAPLRVDSRGRLVLQTSLGEVYEDTPFAYQIEGRRQKTVPVSYRIMGENRYSFEVSNANPNKELMIDPLIYSTHFPSRSLNALATDANRNKIVCGQTWHSNFPITPGAYQEEPGHGNFLTKLDPDADSILFSTYFPGGAGELQVDPLSQSIWLIGSDRISGNWPMTEDAFDTVSRGDEEIAIARITADGATLEFGSYLGGDSLDAYKDTAVDLLGNLYIVGFTDSPDFPVTPNALYPDFIPGSQAFLSMIDPNTFTLTHSTLYSSSMGHSELSRISVSNPRYVWIRGTTGVGGIPITPDAYQSEYSSGFADFFALLDLHAPEIRYSSYFGGQGMYSLSTLIAIDTSHVWLVGDARGASLIIPPGGYDSIPPDSTYAKIYVLEFELPNSIVRGTFIGRTDVDLIRGAQLAEDGSPIITGRTENLDFPVTPNAYDTVHAGGDEPFERFDVFLSRFSLELISKTFVLVCC